MALRLLELVKVRFSPGWDHDFLVQDGAFGFDLIAQGDDFRTSNCDANQAQFLKPDNIFIGEQDAAGSTLSEGGV